MIDDRIIEFSVFATDNELVSLIPASNTIIIPQAEKLKREIEEMTDKTDSARIRWDEDRAIITVA